MTYTPSVTAVITGTGYSLPGEAISSQEIEARVASCNPGLTLPRGIVERLSGVATRHHAPEQFCSSDLATQAGLCALRNANLEPEQIDMLMFASTTHDISEPATAAIVQEKIGCSRAHVFDIKNACNSFLNGLDVAHAFIQTGRARRVLITVGEITSPFIAWKINDSQDIALKLAGLTLGDGGGACVVEGHKDTSRGLLAGKFFSDGTQWRLSTVMSGGSLLKHDFSKLFFECNSQALFNQATIHFPGLISQALAQVGWDLHRDKPLIVPHQVSVRSAQAICKFFDYPLERCMITVNKLGNTAAASIPIALSLAVHEGKLRPNDKVLLVGGAAGFSAAVIPLIW